MREIVSQSPQTRLQVQRVPGGVAFAGKETLAAERFSGGGKRISQSCGLGSASLREIFAAAPASAQLGHGLFEQRPHVVGLAGGLGEDQRGLRRLGGEEGATGSVSRNFLG